MEKMLLFGGSETDVNSLASALSEACGCDVHTSTVLSDAINAIREYSEAIVIVDGVGGTDDMWRKTFGDEPNYRCVSARLARYIRTECSIWGAVVPLVVLLSDKDSLDVAGSNELFMSIGRHGETLPFEGDVFSLACEINLALAECKRRQ